jgi:hypothetical protein
MRARSERRGESWSEIGEVAREAAQRSTAISKAGNFAIHSERALVTSSTNAFCVVSAVNNNFTNICVLNLSQFFPNTF